MESLDSDGSTIVGQSEQHGRLSWTASLPISALRNRVRASFCCSLRTGWNGSLLPGAKTWFSVTGCVPIGGDLQLQRFDLVCSESLQHPARCGILALVECHLAMAGFVAVGGSQLCHRSRVWCLLLAA